MPTRPSKSKIRTASSGRAALAVGREMAQFLAMLDAQLLESTGDAANTRRFADGAEDRLLRAMQVLAPTGPWAKNVVEQAKKAVSESNQARLDGLNTKAFLI